MRCEHLNISTHGRCLGCDMQVYESKKLNRGGNSPAQDVRQTALRKEEFDKWKNRGRMG